ncbi:uncharacterized protein LOC124540205 [Vanessa cardui]|uniref:uncharacterized protein LOC124540205 n=1 Tax=Vanessa cardui TaxID=171605 RepID=UPI001F129F56|nr:uncharacterized protein LOC124540205 [Vanessa cardui]
MKLETSAIILLSYFTVISPKSFDIHKFNDKNENDIDNDIIDFDDEYSVKYDKKYEVLPWDSSDFNKNSYKYTIVRDDDTHKQTKDDGKDRETEKQTTISPYNDITEVTTEPSAIPIELLSTTENSLITIAEGTSEPDLTVIPLVTTERVPVVIIINQTVTLPVSTESPEDVNSTTVFYEMTTRATNFTETTPETNTNRIITNESQLNYTFESFTENPDIKSLEEDTTETFIVIKNLTDNVVNITDSVQNRTENRKSNKRDSDEEVPIFTELDVEDLTEVPEDYYDTKDVVPTPAPKTDALSVIFGFAGSVVESVVESVAERVVPKGLYDLFKRMQRQSELLEAEKLRSREENGGIGQFTRGVIKTISSGLSKPLSQLMAGARDIGSLDNDHGFIGSLASGVTSVANVANSMVDVFKDRVQAIYPGTIWCGDGHSAQARSGDLGLFFFTDTCCRQHDACKMYILAGETKFGLTNTGLFTRSHCSCDAKFRECLRKTNSLVSAQIGLTYFNVLGPQCFRKTHPIVRCVRRTRITGLKCEEYELDYTKPKMWQWFDNETY